MMKLNAWLYIHILCSGTLNVWHKEHSLTLWLNQENVRCFTIVCILCVVNLVFSGKSTSWAIDARETAPASAVPAAFVNKSLPLTGIILLRLFSIFFFVCSGSFHAAFCETFVWIVSHYESSCNWFSWYVIVVSGALSIGVPGEVLGYYKAWSRFGRLPWRRLVQPTIDLCRNGYQVEYALAEALKDGESLIRQNSGLRFVEHKYSWSVNDANFSVTNEKRRPAK